MKKLKQWVNWDVINGTKVPITPSGNKASSVDSSTWCKYGDLSGNYNKGFVLTDEDDYIVIDLDHCINGKGKVAKWAKEIIKKSKTTYAEISPSGDGLHLWLRGKLSSNHKRRPNYGKHKIEVYQTKRFVTMTFNPIVGASIKDISKISKGIKWLQKLTHRDEVSLTDDTSPECKDLKSTDAIIAKLKEDGKWFTPEDGIDDNGTRWGSDSDFKFLNVIADYVGKPCPKAIADVYLASEVVRDKVANRIDYHINNMLRSHEWASLGGEKVSASQSGYKIDMDVSGSGIYMHNNLFYVYNGVRIYEDLTTTTARIHWEKMYNPDKGDKFYEYVTIVHKIKHSVVFDEPSSVKEADGVLHITINPMENWELSGTPDERIIHDFRDNIMHGKMRDIIDLIVGSIVYKETKLNKLLVTGVSDKGKTFFANHMDFVEMTAKEFSGVIPLTKKWSKEKSAKLRKTGLLLCDDIKSTIPDGVKNIKDSINLDIMNVGAIVHPMKMMLLTSTTSSLLDMADKEIRNRFLHIHIEGDETVPKSKIYHEDTNAYSEAITLWIKQQLRDAFNNPLSYKKFEALQNKYRLSDENEFEELLEVARIQSAERLSYALDDASGVMVNPSVFKGSDGYYVKGIMFVKAIVTEVVNEVFDGMNIDYAKHISDLTHYFIGEKRVKYALENGSKRINVYFIKNEIL